jgi:proteasome lid subunit RPN8/RPN11
VLDAIDAHARRDAPHECCGLLIGTETAILEAVPCANVAERPASRYRIAPAAFVDQIHRCRARADGTRVVGAYHSHPGSAPEPSPTDLAEAFEQFVFVIAGPVDGLNPLAIRAFVLTDGNLQPLTLVPDAQEAEP